jgi:S-DNA-T family DNA segregation ATPase FtsK/SpoIIIE
MRCDVFMSYAPDDRLRVMQLVEQLREAGASVWMDPGDIVDPLLRGEKIVEAIDRCKVALVAVSLSSVESRDVLKQAFLASEAGKPLLPLHLEPATVGPALGYQLAGLKPIGLFGGDPGTKLRAVLHALNALGVGADELEAPTEAARLEEVLASLGVEGRIVDRIIGPAVTRYEVEPAKPLRTGKLRRLADDVALALAAVDVRMEPPPPGKRSFALEVPNDERTDVPLDELLSSDEFQQADSILSVVLGVDVGGTPVVADLATLPHLLIGGAANSGKTTLVHGMIAGLCRRAGPDELKLVLIDPKRVELTCYQGIPHLMAPITHTASQAADVLRQTIGEMERRYEVLAGANCRNITEYNGSLATPGERLPYVVVVIDELADLMMAAKAEFEYSICRLAQLARATGIHLVVATQRPSVNVITGTIKANIPSRIAMAVCSVHDSRVILDVAGAERLIGRGDMLYCPVGADRPIRVQGALVTRDEVERLADDLRGQGPPAYAIVPGPEHVVDSSLDEEPHDELYEEAVRLVTDQRQASVSMLQRHFKIGYARAGRLIDMLEETGVVGPANGSKPRDVLLDPEG